MPTNAPSLLLPPGIFFFKKEKKITFLILFFPLTHDPEAYFPQAFISRRVAQREHHFINKRNNNYFQFIPHSIIYTFFSLKFIQNSLADSIALLPSKK